MLMEPAALTPSAVIFEPLATSSTSSSQTSSTRKRLSGFINLRSYATTSLLPSRESHSSRNQKRHSFHGGLFRSYSNRARSPPSELPPHDNNNNDYNDEDDRLLAAASPDALNLNDIDDWAEPNSVAPARTGEEAPSSATYRNDNSSPGPTNRRLSTRFSEAAAEALLRERSSSIATLDEAEAASPPVVIADMTRSRSATVGTPADMSSSESLPSIRLSSFYDPRSPRPSLSFTPVARTLPTGREVIKVGRYSERENLAPTPLNAPSAAPVGFKSKVVSRRHCEFWFDKGKWYIKDVKSSSGTFLNHIRLSAPGTESKPFPINDGDIVQLGIDFKGGEEMIYRCVKMRVELNRGWQSKPNLFNMATHKLLRDMTSTTASSSASHTQDCSICLNAIAPCQSLFVAPCSHTWHFKCIREMLHGSSWPIFVCPNCRATADLDAEVDEPVEDWPQILENDAAEDKVQAVAEVESRASLSQSSAVNGNSHARRVSSDEPGDVTVHFDSAAMPPPQPGPPRHTASDPVPIPNASQRRTPSPVGNSLLNNREGPITPRNDAGPWVFDGNPARVSQESTRRNGMGSLDAAAKSVPKQS